MDWKGLIRGIIKIFSQSNEHGFAKSQTNIKTISCEFAFSEPFGVHPTNQIYSELVELNKLFTNEKKYSKKLASQGGIDCIQRPKKPWLVCTRQQDRYCP